MNYYIIIIFSAFLTGCVMLGKNTIHSPKTENGIEIRSRFVHGGATKRTTNDLVRLNLPKEDSISIVIGAKHITQKSNWGGLVLPVFPFFLIPKVDFYKDNPNTLTLYLLISAREKVKIIRDSLMIQIGEKTFKPIRSTYREKDFDSIDLEISNTELDVYSNVVPIEYYSNLIKIDYPVSANRLDNFNFIPNGILVSDKNIVLPIIKFQKEKQKFVFIGP